MTRQESPAQILNSIAARTVGGLLVMAALPFAIVGILAFNVYDTVKDAVRASGFPDWFYGRRAQ